MHRKIVFPFLIFASVIANAQYKFSGEVNQDYANATAYLNIIKDFKKRNLFTAENIIQESKIDEDGRFSFKGNLISEENKLYKIYIDNCNEGVTDAKHLLNQCDSHLEKLFIANNKDSVFFPLNELAQMFCSLNYSSPKNNAVSSIDSIQEALLYNLYSAKNDAQRKLIYKNCFTQLQKFGKSLKEPLAELYAYHLYADEDSFSRNNYLQSLNKTEYYKDLVLKLKKKYPIASYASDLENQLKKDGYQIILDTENTKTNWLMYLLITVLLASLFINMFLYKKAKLKSSNIKIDYKKVLTKQEQKVLEAINEGLTNKEIAEKLFISLSTVKTHINNIYSKLSVKSRKEIASFF